MSPLFGSDENSRDIGHDEIVSPDHDIGEEEDMGGAAIGQLSLDVIENSQHIYIIAPIAGIPLSDIDITVNDTMLCIAGTRSQPKEFFEHDIHIKNEECFWGAFQRKIHLPESVDFSSIKAYMEYNLLIIYIPKLRFVGQKISIET